MANVKNNASAQETQRKLLDAAGEVFAEKGFHSATIKDITRRAGTNVAAVNYHFGDKVSLYDAVIKRIEEDAMEILPPDAILVGDTDERFVAFMTHLTSRILRRSRAPWEQVLLAREFAKPSRSLDSFLENCVRPVHAALSCIVAEFLALAPTDERVLLTSMSLIAQSVYFLQHSGHLKLLYPNLQAPPDHERVTRHIVAFSHDALHAMRRRLREQ